MRIGQVAEAAGTTVRALRYYEQNGLLRARRSANGYRDYEESAVVRVRNIRRLLGLGFTTHETRLFLPCLDSDLPDDVSARCPASARVIADKLARMDTELAELTVLRDRLARELDRLR